MAELIKIGESFVNLSNVTEITHYAKTEHNAEHYTIGYNGLSGEMCMWVEGLEFEALRFFLTVGNGPSDFVTDIVAKYNAELEAKQYRKNYQELLNQIQETTGCDRTTAISCTDYDSDPTDPETLQLAITWYKEHFAPTQVAPF